MKVGDEGIKRGSEWFVLTAVIIKKDNEKQILNTMRNITTSLNYKFLHWNRIKQYSKRKMIIDEISKEDFTIIHVMIDTTKMGQTKSERIYPYFLGFLLERVCKFIRYRHAVSNIFISSRNNKLSDKEIIQYVQSEKSSNEVDTRYIKSIKFVPNANMRLLQLADICCSSLYNALTKNDSKNWYYVIRLKDKIYSQNGKILGHGFKAFPNIDTVRYLFLLKLL